MPSAPWSAKLVRELQGETADAGHTSFVRNAKRSLMFWDPMLPLASSPPSIVISFDAQPSSHHCQVCTPISFSAASPPSHACDVGRGESQLRLNRASGVQYAAHVWDIWSDLARVAIRKKIGIQAPSVNIIGQENHVRETQCRQDMRVDSVLTGLCRRESTGACLCAQQNGVHVLRQSASPASGHWRVD